MVQTLHPYMCIRSHLSLSELVTMSHFPKLTQSGVLPFDQLVQLLGLLEKLIIDIKSNSKEIYHFKLAEFSLFTTKQTNTHLTVFSADGLSQALNGSFLALSCLAE